MSEPQIRLPKPRKPGSGCIRGIVIGVGGGIAAALLIGLWTSWKATFDECVKDELQLRENYVWLSWEIYDRETRVTRELANSKTIAELRTRLGKSYYNNSKYKDKSLAELRLDLQENQQKLKITEGSENYGRPQKKMQEKLLEFPRYNELQEIFYGNVPATFKDQDLNELRLLMYFKDRIDFLALFLNPLRTVYSETCTIDNVTYNWLGLNRLVYHGTLRTFTDVEKEMIEREKTELPESN